MNEPQMTYSFRTALPVEHVNILMTWTTGDGRYYHIDQLQPCMTGLYS